MAEEALKQIAQRFRETLNPKTLPTAQKWLDASKTQKGFPMMLMKLLTILSVDPNIKLAASIFFKNFIMNHWEPDDDGKDVISGDDRNTIKARILQIMTGSEKPIQAQLSHALGIISQSDFHEKWPTLLPEIVSMLSSEDHGKLLAVLDTTHSIFFRYRVEMKSEELWTQIQYVLEKFQQPLTDLFKTVCGRIQAALDNKEALAKEFKILLLITEIFYSLNSQDIPAFFDTHMDEWMTPFRSFLKFPSAALASTSSDEPTPLDDVQAAICSIVTLYANKYEEQFNKLVPGFVGEVWQLLTRLDEKERYDNLVTKAITFLTSVVKKDWHKNLFASESNLKGICQKVVIPQLKLRDSDVELFNSNGLEYLRRDIEGSDRDTRRRTTVDFVRGLCVHFEPLVTSILKSYVDNLLLEHKKDSAKWVHKDAAMYIILALSAKAKTRDKGITQVNKYINIIDFFNNQVIPELKTDLKEAPILKADCLKFVAEFRYQLPRDKYGELFALCVRALGSEDFVVHTYAAHAIERILTVKEEKKEEKTETLRFGRVHLRPHLKALFTALFKILTDFEDSKENDYVMKAIMRICSVAQEDLLPVTNLLLQSVGTILAQVAKNPKNPSFNHYVFEIHACLIKYMGKSGLAAVSNFEQALFGRFSQILGMPTCQEFCPYVFQLIAQLLEFRKDVTLHYQKIFPTLLVPRLWETRGNIPALTRLLVAYVKRGAEFISPKIEGVLGIFQKLNASRTQDVYGFVLLNALIEFYPLKHLGKYLPEIFKLLFRRLTSSQKTPKFTENIIVTFSLFVGKHGLSPLLEAMEKMQSGIFGTLLEKIWIPGLKTITGAINRKICVVGGTRLLCATPIMIERFKPLCEPLQKALVALVAGDDEKREGRKAGVAASAEKKVATTTETNGFGATEGTEEEDPMDSKFSSAFAKLHFATAPEHDPFADIKNIKEYLSKALSSIKLG